VAHHTVLLFNIFDVSRFESNGLPDQTAGKQPRASAPQPDGNPGRHHGEELQECYHDAVFYRDEIRSLFTRAR
jgi:arginine decarboxylase